MSKQACRNFLFFLKMSIFNKIVSTENDGSAGDQPNAGGRCSGHVFVLFSHNGQQNADVDDPRRRCFP